VRLVCDGDARLSFVGRLAVAADSATLRAAELVSSHGARVGDVTAAVTAIDTASTTLAGPDTLTLAYSTPSLAHGMARDYFLVVDATPLNPRTLAPYRLSQEQEALPARFALWQNRPNPFSTTTTLRFDLPVSATLRLEVFDAQGRRVRTLANGSWAAGYHNVTWDRRNESGGRVRPGVYLYRLTAGSFRAQKKMVLLP
jgi:hypothetical protein